MASATAQQSQHFQQARKDELAVDFFRAKQVQKSRAQEVCRQMLTDLVSSYVPNCNVSWNWCTVVGTVFFHVFFLCFLGSSVVRIHVLQFCEDKLFSNHCSLRNWSRYRVSSPVDWVRILRNWSIWEFLCSAWQFDSDCDANFLRAFCIITSTSWSFGWMFFGLLDWQTTCNPDFPFPITAFLCV